MLASTGSQKLGFPHSGDSRNPLQRARVAGTGLGEAKFTRVHQNQGQPKRKSLSPLNRDQKMARIRAAILSAQENNVRRAGVYQE